MEVFIGIPCYQVEKSICGVLDRLAEVTTNIHIIILDDCSPDGLVEVLNQYNQNQFLSFSYQKHQENRGYGAAQHSLFKCFMEKSSSPEDVLVVVHGDGGSPESELMKLVLPFQGKNLHAALGSRMMSGWSNQRKNGRASYKIIFDFLLTKGLNFVFGLNYTTYATGFRAYSYKGLSQMDFSNAYKDHSFDTEMLLLLNQQKLKVREFPVETTRSQSENESGNNLSVYAKNVIRLLFKYKSRLG